MLIIMMILHCRHDTPYLQGFISRSPNKSRCFPEGFRLRLAQKIQSFEGVMTMHGHILNIISPCNEMRFHDKPYSLIIMDTIDTNTRR
jgi:hypothetical protein